MKGVVTRSETQTPTLDQSVIIPVEGIPQEYLDRYSKVHQTPRVPTKKFIEDVQLLGYDTMMAEESESPSVGNNLEPLSIRQVPNHKIQSTTLVASDARDKIESYESPNI